MWVKEDFPFTVEEYMGSQEKEMSIPHPCAFKSYQEYLDKWQKDLGYPRSIKQEKEILTYVPFTNDEKEKVLAKIAKGLTPATTTTAAQTSEEMQPTAKCIELAKEAYWANLHIATLEADKRQTDKEVNKLRAERFDLLVRVQTADQSSQVLEKVVEEQTDTINKLNADKQRLVGELKYMNDHIYNSDVNNLRNQAEKDSATILQQANEMGRLKAQINVQCQTIVNLQNDRVDLAKIHTAANTRINELVIDITKWQGENNELKAHVLRLNKDNAAFLSAQEKEDTDYHIHETNAATIYKLQQQNSAWLEELQRTRGELNKVKQNYSTLVTDFEEQAKMYDKLMRERNKLQQDKDSELSLIKQALNAQKQKYDQLYCDYETEYEANTKLKADVGELRKALEQVKKANYELTETNDELEEGRDALTNISNEIATEVVELRETRTLLTQLLITACKVIEDNELTLYGDEGISLHNWWYEQKQKDSLVTTAKGEIAKDEMKSFSDWIKQKDGYLP